MLSERHRAMMFDALDSCTTGAEVLALLRRSGDYQAGMFTECLNLAALHAPVLDEELIDSVLHLGGDAWEPPRLLAHASQEVRLVAIRLSGERALSSASEPEPLHPRRQR